MAENLTGATGIKRVLARAFAIGRLREFGDECWRSLQLVVVFMTAALLFGAPTVRQDHAAMPAISDTVVVPPVVLTTVVTVSEVEADPMRPTTLP
jgi:hypothetical protein